MKKKEWNEGLNHMDPDLVEKYVEQKDRLRQKNKKSKGVWLRFGAIAACFLLIVSAMIGVPMLNGNPPAGLVSQDSTSSLVPPQDSISQVDTPSIDTPPVDTYPVIPPPDIPAWEDAKYSADDIAELLRESTYGVATNAYKEVYVPDSADLKIDEITAVEYYDLYQYVGKEKDLDEAEFQGFIDSFLRTLAESLGADVPQLTIKHFSDGLGIINELKADAAIGNCNIYLTQDGTSSFVSLSRRDGDRNIVIEGEAIQIDQRLSDEEILASIQTIKDKLLRIFNVSFPDTRIVRMFDSDSKHGAVNVYIYFYDESAHPLNSQLDMPISDYISITFDNRLHFSGDFVSDDILTKATVHYKRNRADVGDMYESAGSVRGISLSEAETLLYSGYVFGGHSCPLCMAAQDKVDFEGYDFVDIEYVLGYDQKPGDWTVGIPFYAFYKEIGTAKNGNIIYAKTYVAAIEVSGYVSYFEGQQGEHGNR